MSIGSRTILLTVAGILCIFACVPERTTPSFTFPNHSIKLHYDPLSHELTAVDTLSLQYEKNVDRIYFFLHESLHVERVCVGHQDFEIGDMSMTDVDDICSGLTDEWQKLVDSSQIVVVHLPKSLYSDRIEIRYKGTIDLTADESVAWHPVLPDIDSTFFLTSILPREYCLVTDAHVLYEEIDELWRLNRLAIEQKQSCCNIRVKQI